MKYGLLGVFAGLCTFADYCWLCTMLIMQEWCNNLLRVASLHRCWSYVGMVYSKQQLSLAGGCWYTGTVIHEIGEEMALKIYRASQPVKQTLNWILWQIAAVSVATQRSVGCLVHPGHVCGCSRIEEWANLCKEMPLIDYLLSVIRNSLDVSIGQIQW